MNLALAATSYVALALMLFVGVVQAPPQESRSTNKGLVFSSDVDVKIENADLLIRQKGAPAWEVASKIQDPIAIGFVDGDQKIYAGTKAITAPKAKKFVDPDYPSSEQKSAKQCHVSVYFVVDAHGTVRFPKVYSTCSSNFSEAAVEAIKKWDFKPGCLNGVPVAVLVITQVDFMLY